MMLCQASIITENGCDYKCRDERQMNLSLFSQEEEINQVQKALWLREAVEECCQISTTKFRRPGGTDSTVNEHCLYTPKKRTKKKGKGELYSKCATQTDVTHVSHNVSRDVKYDTGGALQCTVKP